MAATPLGVTPVRFETIAGATAHTCTPASGAYNGWWEASLRLHGITGQSARRSDSFAASRDRGSRGAGHSYEVREWLLDYTVNYTTLALHQTRLRTLKGEIRAMEAREYYLVFTEDDGAGSTTTKRVRCTVQGLIPSDQGMKKAHFSVVVTITGSLTYNNSAHAAATAVLTSTGGTVTATNTSTTPTDDVAIIITPEGQKAAANGQRWMRELTVVNRSEGPLHRWPVEITRDTLGGTSTWGHAALAAAGKSATTGYDVEVYVDDYRVYRTDYTEIANGAFNESGTLLWINMTLEGRRMFTIARADGTATTLHLREPIDLNMALPTYFVKVNGANSEVVCVTAQDADANTWTVVRGVRDTTPVSLAAGDVLYWAPVDVKLVYGYTGAGAPLWDDNADRPMILESSASQSTNLRWYWARFLKSLITGDPMGRYNKPASWDPIDNVRMSHDREFHDGKGELYTRWGGFTAAGATHAATATALSLAYQKNGPPERTPYASAWRWLSQIPFTNLAYTVAATTLTMSAPNEAAGEAHIVSWLGRVSRLARYFSGNDACGTAATASSGAQSHSFTAPVRGVEFSIHPWTPQPDSCNHENLIPQEPADGDTFTVTAVDVQFASDQYPVVLWGAEQEAYQVGRPDAPCTLTDELGHTLSIHGIILNTNGDDLHINCLTGAAYIDLSEVSGVNRSVAHRISGDYLRVSANDDVITLAEPAESNCTLSVTVRSAYG